MMQQMQQASQNPYAAQQLAAMNSAWQQHSQQPPTSAASHGHGHPGQPQKGQVASRPDVGSNRPEIASAGGQSQAALNQKTQPFQPPHSGTTASTTLSRDPQDLNKAVQSSMAAAQAAAQAASAGPPAHGVAPSSSSVTSTTSSSLTTSSSTTSAALRRPNRDSPLRPSQSPRGLLI